MGGCDATLQHDTDPYHPKVQSWCLIGWLPHAARELDGGRSQITAPMSAYCLVAYSLADERVGVHLMGLEGPLSPNPGSRPACCLYACCKVERLGLYLMGLVGLLLPYPGVHVGRLAHEVGEAVVQRQRPPDAQHCGTGTHQVMLRKRYRPCLSHAGPDRTKSQPSTAFEAASHRITVHHIFLCCSGCSAIRG